MPESSRGPAASLTRAFDLAADVLADAPAGLLTDFDGTLSPIVSDPALATLVDGADGPLAALAERLAVVAIVTGRAPRDARRMVGVPGVLIAGNHGTEWLEPGADEPAVPDAADGRRRGLEAVLVRVPELPGVSVEDKGSTASVHFRAAPDPGAAQRAILDALGDTEEHGFRLGEGRMIVEVRPIGLGDKGSATRAIIERFGLRGVVVMGDDVTDLDMFRAVLELREAGRLRGVVIGVGGSDREVPPEIATASDAVIATPEDAAVLLARLAERFSVKPGPG